MAPQSNRSMSFHQLIFHALGNQVPRAIQNNKSSILFRYNDSVSLVFQSVAAFIQQQTSNMSFSDYDSWTHASLPSIEVRASLQQTFNES